MTREVQSIILLLVGSAVVRISWGTTYLNYVKEVMRPWLLISGAILVLLGVLALIDALRRRPAGHAHAPGIAWLLLLPVVTIFIVAPPALGAYAAARDVTNSTPVTTSLAPLPAGDPVAMYLSDYVTRAVWDEGRTLVGRQVELTGFVTANPAGGWWLTRLQLLCCAADAFASKIEPVNLPAEAVTLPENTWVTVLGEWVPGGGTGTENSIPLLQVRTINEVLVPENPYD